MKVFKEYFKIIKKSALPTIIGYAALFIIITTFFSRSTSDTLPTSFESSKCPIAIINEDNSPLSSNLEKYIGDNSEVIDIKQDEKSLKDALFYGQCEIIITIPNGFGTAFKSSTPLELTYISAPNSTSSVYLESMLNKFLSTADLYYRSNVYTDENEIFKAITTDLSHRSNVTINSSNKSTSTSAITFYFNYLPYPLICILIYSIAIVTNIFNDKDLKRRNLCSPISLSSFNLQLFLGHGILALIIWIIFIVEALCMYKAQISSTQIILYSINSFIFTLTTLGLSFFIANLIPKKAVSAVCNCVALGTCFLGGAFIPQEFLSETVLKINTVNPVYWFVLSNNKIATINNIAEGNLNSIYLYWLILILFAIAFLALALLSIKQKRTSYQYL